jgi:transposase
MLAEQYDYVIGGDPDRDTVDLAVLDATSAGFRAHLTQTADAAGYAQMVTWAQRQAPGARVWALEGTGNYGAGLASFLAEAGEDVVEIDRVKRARRGGKNDQIDAVRAAREALSREVQVNPRQRGLREAMRVVLTTRHAVLVSRTKAINELKALIVTAPEHLRSGLRLPAGHPARPDRAPSRQRGEHPGAPHDNPRAPVSRRADQLSHRPSG